MIAVTDHDDEDEEINKEIEADSRSLFIDKDKNEGKDIGVAEAGVAEAEAKKKKSETEPKAIMAKPTDDILVETWPEADAGDNAENRTELKGHPGRIQTQALFDGTGSGAKRHECQENKVPFGADLKSGELKDPMAKTNVSQKSKACLIL